MKEKIKNNIRIINEDREVLEKAAKFSDLGKEYVGVSEPELTQEEEISKFPDTVASPEIRRDLIEAVKRADKIVKPTDEGISVKKRKKDVKEDVKGKAKGTLQRNMVRENVKNSESTEKTEENDEKVQEI